ncbi:MAG: hypothetical protein OEM39_06555, partial [Acidimicrobiia bacterium]|nr:hypothetical protein [Acidimicrobiia bacterium]
MIRKILLVTSIVGFAFTTVLAAVAEIEVPITYLERDPTSGRFQVKYQVGGTTTLVSSLEALTAPTIS